MLVKQNKIALILFLAPFVFSFAFGLDIYIPVVPEIKEAFHTSSFMVQMTLSLFMLTVAIGQLVIGPLSDQLGRLKTSLISIVIFIIGSLMCVLAHSIGVLILARIICAFGACGMLVIAYTMIRDLYSGSEFAQMYSWLNAAIGVSPTFAPLIGGILATYYGWRAVFWFLAIMGIMILISTIFIRQETLPVSARQKVDSKILLRYWSIVKSPRFIKNALCTAFGVSICFCFFSISPFILITLLHVSVKTFGLYFALFGLAVGVGGYLAGYIIGKKGIEFTVFVAIFLMILGGLLMLLTNLILGLHIATFLFSMVLSCTGAIFICGACASTAMEPFGKIAGTASAVLQAIQFSLASLIGSILLHFPVVSTIPYSILIILSGGMCFLLTRGELNKNE
jgi:DHA1 family florfenicol/chloramphenicol resistance protein-like MFS transporter